MVTFEGTPGTGITTVVQMATRTDHSLWAGNPTSVTPLPRGLDCSTKARGAAGSVVPRAASSDGARRERRHWTRWPWLGNVGGVSSPEARWGWPQFRADLMWVTRSSGLVTPILIEMEKPNKRWFQHNGRPTAEFRDAHDQLNDWRAWFSHDENSALFRRQYLLFDRFDDRPLLPQFVLIYRRRSEFERRRRPYKPEGAAKKARWATSSRRDLHDIRRHSAEF